MGSLILIELRKSEDKSTNVQLYRVRLSAHIQPNADKLTRQCFIVQMGTDPETDKPQVSKAEIFCNG